MQQELRAGIVRVIVSTKAGETLRIGTGFIVTDDGLIATCAHVVHNNAGSEQVIMIEFHGTSQRQIATIVPEMWRPPGDGDIAFLRIHGPLPLSTKALALGSSKDSAGHMFYSWGYRLAEDFDEGLAAEGKIQASTIYRGRTVLQLLTDQIDIGMSGSPIWDTQGQRVVGMANYFWETSRHIDAWLAIATPIEALKEACPTLVFSDIHPYRGLSAYTEVDAGFFHGRQRVIHQVLGALRRSPRFVAILGPSGSGKTSLLQAGVIPRLRQNNIPGSDYWGIVLVSGLGDHPFRQLAEAGLVMPTDTSNDLVAAAGEWIRTHPDITRLVLVLDQLEELLVSCPPVLLDLFTAQLAALLECNLPVTVVLIMRDDFYSRLISQMEALRTWVAGSLVNVPVVLEPDEIRSIVEEPAKTVGLRFETGLVRTIVQDVIDVLPNRTSFEIQGQSTVLPLLEFTLSQLWERRQEGMLTHAAYQASGGITGSLTQWADKAFYSLPQGLRSLARRVLTDLVYLADADQPFHETRRQKALLELCHNEMEQDEVVHVVRHFADARLLITTQDLRNKQEIAVIVHDTLIWEWALLQQWLDEDRQFIMWRQRIELRAREWSDTDSQIANRDEGKLLRGHDLSRASELLPHRDADLNLLEREYIQASIDLEYRERAAQARMKRRITYGVLGAIAIALVLILMVLQQRGLTEYAHVTTTAAVEARLTSVVEEARQRQIAQSRQLAAFAQQAMDDTGSGLALSSLLAIESLSRYQTVEGDQALRRALTLLMRPSSVVTTVRSVNLDQISYSRDGQWFAAVDGIFHIGVWNLITGLRVLDIPSPKPSRIIIGPNSEWLLTTANDTEVQIWSLESGKQIKQLVPESTINDVAISTDGKRIAISGQDGVVRIWMTDSWTRTKDLVHNHRLDHIAFSPDSHWLATTGDGGVISFWDLTELRLMKQTKHPYQVLQMVFSTDSRWLATMNWGNSVQVWDVRTGSVAANLKHGTELQAIAFSPDGRWLATSAETRRQGASPSYDIWLWQTNTWQVINQISQTQKIYGVDFSPDSQLLATAGGDGTVRLWSSEGWNEVARALSDGVVYKVVFSPDGKWLTSTNLSQGTGKLWRVDSVSQIPRMQHEGIVGDIAFSPDSLSLVSASEDNTARIWLIQGRQEVSRFKSGSDVTRVIFSPNGKQIATLEGNMVRLWNIKDGEENWRVTHNGIIHDIAFDLSGSRIATSGSDHTGRIWDVKMGRELVHVVHDGLVSHIIFSPDGKWIATASDDKTTRLWDAQTGREVARIEQSGYVSSIAFSTDSRMLATGDSVGTVRVWNIEKSQTIIIVRHAEQVNALAFSPDGDWLATGGDDGISRVWEVATGLERSRFVHEFSVSELVFSMDGRWLITNSGNPFEPYPQGKGEVQVWSIETGNEVVTIHSAAFTTVRLSPDGKWLAAASRDHSVELWLWRPTDLIAEACERLPRNLAPVEWQRYFGSEPYHATCTNLPLPQVISETNNTGTLVAATTPTIPISHIVQMEATMTMSLSVRDATSTLSTRAESSSTLATSIAQAVVNALSLTATPDQSSGSETGGFGRVEAFPLEGNGILNTYWLVHTADIRSDYNRSHFVAVYKYNDRKWQQLGKVELPEFDNLSVSQIHFEDDQYWLSATGFSGAHSGCFAVLSFDGNSLHEQVSHCTEAGSGDELKDLDGDGRPEVVLDDTDNYVFCYACNVHLRRYQIMRWNGIQFVNAQLVPNAGASDAQVALNQSAVTSANAGLWKDAQTLIGKALAIDSEDQSTKWNAIIIGIFAEARGVEARDGNYPLLGAVFYGDYDAALAVMRGYSAEQLFGPPTPLIDATIANGFEHQVSQQIIERATMALQVQPDLAAAYFLRGWAEQLRDPGSAEALADVERALYLRPDEPLFSLSVAYLKR